ncbi:MAG: YciC family protein [Candidatus Parvarchaeum sp.]
MTFDAVSIFKKSFVMLFTDPFLFGLAIVYALIYIIFGVYLSYSFGDISKSIANISLINLSYLLIYTVLVFLATTFISGMAFLRVAGKKKTLNKMIVKACKRYPSLLATTFLTSVVIMLGFIAFIIPGIYLAFKLILSPVSSVVEDKSPIDAMKRSWHITLWNWWRIFALFLLFYLVLLVISFLPYISYFFAFVIVISYPLLFTALKKRINPSYHIS